MATWYLFILKDNFDTCTVNAFGQSPLVDQTVSATGFGILTTGHSKMD